MEIIVIAAIGENYEIGKGNNLLWKLPADMKFFKEITEGHTVIMGRKTYESIPEKYRPLKNRKNIVISTTKDYNHEGAITAVNFYDALGVAEEIGDAKVFIIGGSSVYERAIKLADTLLLTEVEATFEDADTFFPEIDILDYYSVRTIHKKNADDKHKYSFKIKEYIK